MYKLEQEVYLDGKKCAIVRKTEEWGVEAEYTLLDEGGSQYHYNVKESRLSATLPNALTTEEFMEVYKASPYLCTGLKDLQGLREFVEECFRSKNV